MHECDAFEWMSEHGVESYTSNQRLGETGWRLFDLNYGSAAVLSQGGIALNKSSFYVLEDSRSTKGAQEFPFRVVVINKMTIEMIPDASNVMHIGGSADDQVSYYLTR